MELQRPKPTKLSSDEAEFEKRRFEHYQSERGTKLDPRAIEAWELFHNDRDGTNTQYTKNQVDDLEKFRNPIASINLIMPIIKYQKAALTNDRSTDRVLPAFRVETGRNI